MPTAEQIISALSMQPHPEGGYYVETFRALPLTCELPERGVRAASTAIYYLLRSGEFSALHVVRSDEVWHHYLGAPAELHCFDESGTHRSVRLGSNIIAGERPQHVVRAGELQATCASASGFTLFGCTVAPGFDFADFSMPTREELFARLPQHRELVLRLTRG